MVVVVVAFRIVIVASFSVMHASWSKIRRQCCVPSNCCDVVASTSRNPKEWSRSMGIASRWGNHGRVSCCGFASEYDRYLLGSMCINIVQAAEMAPINFLDCTYEEEIMRGRKKKL